MLHLGLGPEGFCCFSGVPSWGSLAVAASPHPLSRKMWILSVACCSSVVRAQAVGAAQVGARLQQDLTKKAQV